MSHPTAAPAAGPIAQAVITATKAQVVADADGTPAQFDAYWRAFTPWWPAQHIDWHHHSQIRDEAVARGRA